MSLPQIMPSTLFCIAQACHQMRAGLAITIETQDADDPMALLSLDFAPRKVIEVLMESGQARLFLSAARLQSLSKASIIERLSNPAAISLPLSGESLYDTLPMLAQGNPESLSHLAESIFSEAQPANETFLSYLKLSQSLPAGILVPVAVLEDAAFAAPEFNLPDYHNALGRSLTQVGATPIPLDHVGDTRMHLFRDCLGSENHMAIEVGTRPAHDGGNPIDTPILVRVHSSCVTGDIFHSQRCDCGHQLAAALAAMRDHGYGILVYLAQEGRGIGLNNKLKSYLLQQAGLDTVDGNLALGFQDDERDFAYAARILALMGAESIDLLTNNPKKVESLQMDGINIVKRVPLVEIHNSTAAEYVATKVEKSGHVI